MATSRHAPLHSFAEDFSTADAAAFTDNMQMAAGLWHKVVQQLSLSFLDNPTIAIGHTDPLNISETFMQIAGRIGQDPEQLYQSNLNLWQDHLQLWQQTTQKLLGQTPDNEPEIKDRRFRDDAWQDNSFFDYLKRSYLINSGWVQQTVGNVSGLDDHTSQKASFFTRQFLDALSPSNFMMTNPEVMRNMLESKGESLVHGLQNMLTDIERGEGKLRIRMTDEDAFTLGENIATTPGHVVYENDLMQLIQYKPSTKQVYSVPLLITPAWINKYYILDLREENSFIRWMVEQGYTVFVISWVNPDETLGRKCFDDYLAEGPLAALDVIEEITGQQQTSIMGYCLGGTLTAILLAYLRSHGEASRVASVTYLTTMVDFTDAGELSVFIDDEQLSALEERMSEQGYLDGPDMNATFNMLRSNDLIWSFVINNYLLGKDPFPFDLLYWNSDSTRMPAAMHSFYLRNMYQKNLLAKPGGIEVMDTPINITKITTPSYVLSAKDDHIAPWKSTYAGTQIYDGSITFTLAQSGHIAGVINPPSKHKYGYWTNDNLPAKADQWFDGAQAHDGSWWGHWHAWNKKRSGKKVPARKVGSKRWQPIEPAPGAYAKLKV